MEKEIFEDDIKKPISHLVGHRLPWLILGLLGGIFTSFIVSRFEHNLSNDIRLVFFIPVIVYMSDAIGTQTETIYIRHLQKGHANFLKYFLKETGLGLSLGAIFGLIIGLFAYYWLHSAQIGLTVGLAMLANVTLAPILATVIPAILYKERSDPALGSGPVATIIQDFISLLIYFVIASLIVL